MKMNEKQQTRDKLELIKNTPTPHSTLNHQFISHLKKEIIAYKTNKPIVNTVTMFLDRTASIVAIEFKKS